MQVIAAEEQLNVSLLKGLDFHDLAAAAELLAPEVVWPFFNPKLLEAGQVFTFYGFRLEIVRKQRNRISSLNREWLGTAQRTRVDVP